MKDEIKEILEWLEFRKNYGAEIDEDDLKLLLDYITNLQEEKEDNLKCIKSLKGQLESVINENQRLLKQWFENNNKTVELASDKEYYKQSFNDYKTRNEKAIEYIKSNLDNTGWLEIGSQDVEVLINLLQGSDE